MVSHKPIRLLSAGVTLSIFGLGLALFSAAVTIRGYAAKSFATTEARIVRSEIVVTKRAAGIIRGFVAWSDYYTAKIEYEYTVNDQRFVGNKFGIGKSTGGYGPAIAEALVAKYPLGKQITIYYYPKKPSFSLIDPTVNFVLWWAGIVAGLVLLAAGAVVWIKAIRLDEAQQARGRLAATPKAARPRLEGVVAASVHGTQRGSGEAETVEVRMHWLLRTLAVGAGLVLFFFGSLALPICARMGVPAKPNAAGGNLEGIIAYVIVMTIVGGMTLVGAFLVRLGMRRSKRRLKLPATPPAGLGQAESGQADSGPAELGPAPAALPDFGAFIAKCGPQVDGINHYLVLGAVALVAGVLGVLAPDLFLEPKPEEEAMVKAFLWLFGGALIVSGICMLWYPLFGQNKEILLYERGVVERVGAISYGIALDEIEQLRIQEYYEHRFAPRKLNVRVKVSDEREFSFDSALRGQSEQIIAYLAERVPQTQFIPFQA